MHAEEEANRLMDELKKLKKEIESYKTASEALDQAAAGISELSTRCAEIAEQLGSLAETLRSIGTPELLRELKGLAGEVGMLRKDLGGAVSVVRNLALASVALLVIALGVLTWLALALARG